MVVCFELGLPRLERGRARAVLYLRFRVLRLNDDAILGDVVKF